MEVKIASSSHKTGGGISLVSFRERVCGHLMPRTPTWMSTNGRLTSNRRRNEGKE